MNTKTNTALWNQFGASIDMLENAINKCPEKYWNDSSFWYIAYHTLFWLDFYLSDTPKSFKPPVNYTLSEFDPEGGLPDRIYSKDELLVYLHFCRNKCYRLIFELNPEKAEKLFDLENKNYSIFEIILYNMRHVQHHTAQLNLLLRQEINDSPDWVSRVKQVDLY